MKVFLDDTRDPKVWLPAMRWFKGRDPDELDEWVWARTAQEAIALLESEDIAEVSLDHDLGPREEVGDGHDVVAWVEQRVALYETYVPPVIHVHSSNVAGRARLEAAAESIERMIAKRGGKR